MSEKQTLLAILELASIPDRLLERSIWLARTFKYRIHLVLYEPGSGVLFGGLTVSKEADAMREELRRARNAIVEEYAETIRNADIEVETSVMEMRPLSDGILALGETVKPSLVVKSSEFHTAAQRSILIDTDWQLLRRCPYPLWLVRSETMRPNPLVVAAVDPCNAHDKPAALDHEIVRTAKTIAEATDGDMHLLHVYERLVGIGKAANRAIKATKLPIDEIDARIKAEHRDALDALAKHFDVENKKVHQLPGKTHEILPTYTRSHGAGLMVMGVLARSGLKRMLIGSTAERVIDHLACDVLILRPTEDRQG